MGKNKISPFQLKKKLNIIPYDRINKKKKIPVRKTIFPVLNKLKNEGYTSKLSWKKFQTMRFPRKKNKLNPNQNHILICGKLDHNKKNSEQVVEIDLDVEKNGDVSISDMKKILKSFDISPFQIYRTGSGGFHSLFLVDGKEEIKRRPSKLINTKEFPELKNINLSGIDICGVGGLEYYIPNQFRKDIFIIDKNGKKKFKESIILPENKLLYENKEVIINSSQNFKRIIDNMPGKKRK